MSHSISHFVQARGEAPGWVFLSSHHGPTQTEDLVERQSSRLQVLSRPTDSREDIAKAFFKQKMRPQDQQSRVVCLVQMLLDRVEVVACDAAAPDEREFQRWCGQGNGMVSRQIRRMSEPQATVMFPEISERVRGKRLTTLSGQIA